MMPAESPVEVHLPAETLTALEAEAKRRRISLEELLVHAALLYVADLESGRIASLVAERMDADPTPPEAESAPVPGPTAREQRHLSLARDSFLLTAWRLEGSAHERSFAEFVEHATQHLLGELSAKHAARSPRIAVRAMRPVHRER